MVVDNTVSPTILAEPCGVVASFTHLGDDLLKAFDFRNSLHSEPLKIH